MFLVGLVTLVVGFPNFGGDYLWQAILVVVPTLMVPEGQIQIAKPPFLELCPVVTFHVPFGPRRSNPEAAAFRKRGVIHRLTLRAVC